MNSTQATVHEFALAQFVRYSIGHEQCSCSRSTKAELKAQAHKNFELGERMEVPLSATRDGEVM
jgi:hypothetical protein